MSTNLASENYSLRLETLYQRKASSDLTYICKLTDKYLHPEQAFKSIHVAGTNGKGSVSTKIARALEADGYKVGLYTSPHISCFRERIQINGKKISEEALLRLLPDQEEGSFFDITTLLAFLWFKEEKVDYAVIETGLGGRLDSTNIIRPILSIITSISLDHTEILGTTVEAIANEKGGIVKEGVPLIVGPTADYYAKGLVVSGDFKNYDEENKAIAKTALINLNVSDPSITQGLQASPPCRMERINDNVLLDVAHNPAGFKKLVAALSGEKWNICLAISKNKDIPLCLSLLKPIANRIVVTESTNERTLPAYLLEKELLKAGYESSQLTVIPDTSKAVKYGLELKGKLLVTGSFFIMGSAKEAL